MNSTFRVTFTYSDGEVSVHDDLTIQAAQNLGSYNLANDGLVSVLIEVVAK